MPRGKDSYQALPGYDKLTWTDHIRIGTVSDFLKTNPQTGTVENPRREYMKNRIKVREDEERQAAAASKKGEK